MRSTKFKKMQTAKEIQQELEQYIDPVKRDKDLLVQFLEKHCKVMPRTTLRYAIEKFPEEERKEFMKR